MLSAHPQRQWVDYLLRGLSFGFSTGYTGPHHPRHSHNLPLAASRPEVISSYIAKVCASGHTAGPFMHPPFPNFIVNPLGAVPKKRTGKWRLIMHLSFPPGASVNDGIDIANFPLRYSTVADAMDSCMLLGRGALMAKLDVQSTFRLCPVLPDEHHLLGMCWQGRYFFDRVLPFGLRSALFVFNTLAEALEWIARQHGLTYIHHYLDDFFVAGAPDSPACSAHLRTLTSLCNTLGIPLAKEKLEGPATQLEYLGILLDTDLLDARLPLDKLHDLKSALSSWLQRSSCYPSGPQLHTSTCTQTARVPLALAPSAKTTGSMAVGPQQRRAEAFSSRPHHPGSRSLGPPMGYSQSTVPLQQSCSG